MRKRKTVSNASSETILAKTMAYETPRATIFHNRRRFHATQKSISESISDWFKRLQAFANNCEFKQIADYMLIDKFLSGLSDTDFEKISQVPIWTVDELILVVIGNAHIFTCKELKHRQESQESKEHVRLQRRISADELGETQGQNSVGEIRQFKVENVVEMNCVDDAHCELGGSFDDRLSEGGESQPATMKHEALKADVEGAPLTKPSKPKKIPLTPSEKSRNYIQRLKITGKYEDYKRVKAELAKQSRLKVKQNEEYLPSELQLHILNERRRATRERVLRCRARKRRNCVEPPKYLPEPDVVLMEPKSEPDADPVRESVDEQEMEHESEPGDDIKRSTRLTRTKRKMKTTRRKLSHLRKRTLECYLCSLKCPNLHQLKTHLTIFHRPVKRVELKCTHCSQTSTSRAVLSRHLRKVHGEYRVLKCPCCDKDFKKRLDLDLHIAQSHPDYRPFICESCGKSYKRISDLNVHTRVHTGQRFFKCEICGHNLASRGGYSNHMLIHTGTKPYSCDFCGKAFRSLSSLSKHLVCVHRQGEKQHPCDICAKRFASSYHLKLHYNSHTGNRPFQCDTCGNAFTQPSSLKLHMRRVHGKNSQSNLECND